MTSKRSPKCLCCGDLFKADVRNRGRQKYCPKQACRAAGKAARQRRWLAKPENENYFREPDNAARVREWQHAHPGHWHGIGGGPDFKGAPYVGVRDRIVIPVEAGVRCLMHPHQDALRLQGTVLIGLIAHLSDSTLQDDIAQTSRRLLQLGQDILSRKGSDARHTGAAP